MVQQKFFLVIKRGVYVQGIYGIYKTKAEAYDALHDAKTKEPDDYHDFEVREAILGRREYI